MSREGTKIDTPVLAFEARITGVRVKRVPSGVLLESETSRLVRMGPDEPTSETPSLILISTEVIEAAAALLGWRPPETATEISLRDADPREGDPCHEELG